MITASVPMVLAMISAGGMCPDCARKITSLTSPNLASIKTSSCDVGTATGQPRKGRPTHTHTRIWDESRLKEQVSSK